MLCWFLLSAASATPQPDDIAAAAYARRADPFDPIKRPGIENANSDRRDCSSFVNDTIDRGGFGFENLNSRGRWERAVEEGRAIEVDQGRRVSPCPELGAVAFFGDTTEPGQGISHVGIVAQVDQQGGACSVTVVDHRGYSHGRDGVRSFPMDLQHPDDTIVADQVVNHILRVSDRALATRLLVGFVTPLPVVQGERVAIAAPTPSPRPAPQLEDPLLKREVLETPEAVRGVVWGALRSGVLGGVESFTAAELALIEPSELRLLRNLLFARYRLAFEDHALRCVFGQQPWYQPSGSITPDLALQGFTGPQSALLNRILREEEGRRERRLRPDRMAALVACEGHAEDLERALAGRGNVLERIDADMVRAIWPEERDVVMRMLVEELERPRTSLATAEVLSAGLYTLVKLQPQPLPPDAAR